MRLFVVLCVLYPVACLLADDTALNDGSEGPMPVGGLNGPESVIQMVSEAIDVDMGRKVSDVDCHFTFRSHKRSGNAFQLVGFPDLAAAVAEAERRTGGKEMSPGNIRSQPPGQSRTCRPLSTAKQLKPS